MPRREKKPVNYNDMIQGIGGVSASMDYNEVSGANNTMYLNLNINMCFIINYIEWDSNKNSWSQTQLLLHLKTSNKDVKTYSLY